MKIAISSFGDELNSSIDNRFGRCQNFLILDEEGELEKTIDNEGVNAPRGAGIQAAQSVVNEGVEVLITGNIGPNAFSVLRGSGVEVYLAPTGVSVKEAFEKWQDNELSKAESPSGPPGRGRGMGRGPKKGSRKGSGRGRKSGPGRGRNRPGNPGSAPERE